MGTRRRDALELRAITVSARSALRRATSPGDAERIRTMGSELLVRLEERVLHDGADPDMLERIEAARRAMWEDAPEG